MIDHGVRDPRILSGRRVRLYECDGTTQFEAGFRGGGRSRANGVALRSTRGCDAGGILVVGASILGGIRRGVALQSSAIVF